MVEESIAKNNFTHVSQTKPPWAKYYLLYGSQLLNVKIEKISNVCTAIFFKGES